MSISVAVVGDPANSFPTADPTLERIPPEELFEPVEVRLLLDDLELVEEVLFALRLGAESADLPDDVFLTPPLDFEALVDSFAPPEAVLFPAPPLLFAVDVFDPPELAERVALAAVFFDAEDLDLVSEVVAPVFEEADDFPLLLLTELPVLAVGDLESLLVFPEAVVFFESDLLAVEAFAVLCVFGILCLL